MVFWETVFGAYNGDRFKDLIERLLPKFLARCYLILDNAAFHKRNDVRQLIESSGRNLLFLPPYSPQLNPIEEFFSMFKSKQKSIRPRPRDDDELLKTVENAMQSVMNHDLSAFYRHMRQSVQMGKDNKPF